MDKFIKEEKYNAIKEMWTSAFQELVKVEVSIELNQTTALTMISPEAMQQRGQIEAQVAKMKGMVKTQEQIVQRLEKRLSEARSDLEKASINDLKKNVETAVKYGDRSEKFGLSGESE